MLSTIRQNFWHHDVKNASMLKLEKITSADISEQRYNLQAYLGTAWLLFPPHWVFKKSALKTS